MRLYEFANSSIQVAAIAQFLNSRNADTDSAKRISVDAFLSLIGNLGISFTRQQLEAAVAKEPLSNIIEKIDGDEVVFIGDTTEEEQAAIDAEQATVDDAAADAEKAEDNADRIVSSMSKRAAKKSR